MLVVIAVVVEAQMADRDCYRRTLVAERKCGVVAYIYIAVTVSVAEKRRLRILSDLQAMEVKRRP